MARGRIASLYIGLGVNTAQVDKGLDKTKKQIRSFAGSIRTQLNVAGLAFTALGATGAAGLTAIYKSSSQTLDRMAKLSDQVGVTVGGLQSLRYAAELNGVSTQKMDSSVERFVKRLGEAKTGSGAAVKALDDLNISAEYLASLGTENAIKTIADEIGKMTSQADQAATTAALFGREGVGLVNVFRDGAQAINDANAELKSYGILLNRADLAKIEAANDAWTRVGTILQGVGQIFSAEIAPFVEVVAVSLLNASREAGGFRVVVVNAMETVALSIAKVGDAITGFKIGWRAIKVAATWIEAHMIKFLSGFDRSLTSILNKIPGISAETSKHLERRRLQSEISYRKSRARLADLMSNQSAAEGVKEWFATVRAEADKAAEKIANVRKQATMPIAPPPKSIIDQPAANDAPDDDSKYSPFGNLDDLKQQASARLETINTSLLTEDQRFAAAYANRQWIVQNAFEQGLINENNRNLMLQNLEQQHQDQINRIVESGIHTREKFEQASFKSQIKSVAGNLATITATAAQHNKKLFKINKAANIANAVMNAYTGASKSLATYPMPLAAVMAGLHLAAGFANVRAIKSQSFGSTSMSAGGVSSVSADSINVPQPVGNLEDNLQSEQKPQVTIIVNGHVLDKTGLEDLVQEATQNITARDGLLFEQGTAQSQVVAA